MSKREFVLGLNESYLRDQLQFNEGIVYCSDAKFIDAKNNGLQSNMFFMSRLVLEKDVTKRHPIPYAATILRFAKVLKIGVYKRLGGGGEARLSNNYSAGFGGHVDLEDVGSKNFSKPEHFFEILRGAMVRELAEEMSLDPSFAAQHLQMPGVYIYDNSNEVGKVHLGVIGLLDLGDASADANVVLTLEDGLEFVGWRTPLEVIQMAETDTVENWTLLLARYLLASA